MSQDTTNTHERLRGILSDVIVVGLRDNEFIIRWLDAPQGDEIIGRGHTIEEAIADFDEWYSDNYGDNAEVKCKYCNFGHTTACNVVCDIGDDAGFTCTRLKDHEGPHAACGTNVNEHPITTWE